MGETLTEQTERISGYTRKQSERFFRRQGLPHLIEGHSVGRDVFGRSSGFLVAVILLETVGLIDGSWSWWQNSLAVVGALAVIVGLYILLNLVRGRAWSTLPQRVGWPELTFFVVAPAIAAFATAAGWEGAVVYIVFNLLVLAITRVVVGLGVLSSLGWGVARLAGEFGTSLRRLIRLLPLVLIFSIVLFFNTEVWQVFDKISGQGDITLALFFLIIIVSLTTAGARREAEAALAEAGEHASPRSTQFNKNQQRNIVAMVASSQLRQVLVVSLATGVFFILVGTLTITEGVREAWAIDGASWHLPMTFLGAPLLVDQTLVRVAVALATFNGLYYAINVQVDAVYRTDLVDDIAAQLNEVVQVREHYLGLIDQAEAAAASEKPAASSGISA